MPPHHEVHRGKVTKVDPDRLFRDVGALGNAPLDPVKELGFLCLVTPFSNIASNPYEVVPSRLTGDIPVTPCNLAKNHLYEIARYAKLLVIPIGADKRDFLLLRRRQSSGEVRQVKVGIQSSWANA